MKAAARVIYRGSWETERPALMRKYGWETSNSEVLISTPRRFGVRAPTLHTHPPSTRVPRVALFAWQKTFSIAIFCACLSLAFGLEVHYSV